MIEPLVSIVMPCYNSELYIKEAIDSVINQTYKNWELLIVDDISTDNTCDIVKSYCSLDKRVKYFKLERKGGASIARNFAIKKAAGRFIAFLDADDIWLERKLDNQVNFMLENDYAFSYTYFTLIDNDSNSLNLLRKAPNLITYKTALKGNLIGCLTVMYDVDKTGLIQIPYLKKRNDAALWLRILKKVEKGHLLPLALSKYRKNEDSLSSGSKFLMLKHHYLLYYRSENFSLFKSLYYCIWNVITYKKAKIKYEVTVQETR